MKLLEAAEILGRPPASPPSLSASLAVGFEPLHLWTLLAAELAQATPAMELCPYAGTFDDLSGSISAAVAQRCDAIAVVIEWADLDPRLGLRRLGGWQQERVEDIVQEVDDRLEALAWKLQAAAEEVPVVVGLPSLPLPTLFMQRPSQSGPEEIALRSAVAGFARRVTEGGRVDVLSSQQLDLVSPAEQRRNITTELNAGFPFSVPHAAAFAEQLAGLLVPSIPKKGLITDLDGTLWAGVVGEDGPEALAWDLDSGGQRHGLYQQFLGSLVSAGVLVGVVSRNDPVLAARALARSDLAITADVLFPIRTGWGAKSELIAAVIDTWNVSADAVVFVDDSPLEIGEAVAVLPGVHGVRFPQDDAGLLPFLGELRALFGKRTATPEDRLRLTSSRHADAYRTAVAQADAADRQDEFLSHVGATIDVAFGEQPLKRALDLLNKTNQFNLNGRRYSEPALLRALRDHGRQLATIAYEDRFGPLGTIAALLIERRADTLVVESWAMSCRALARRIEDHTLHELFSRFDVASITLDFAETERNAPMREFLEAVTGAQIGGPVCVERRWCEENRHRLVHRVRESLA